MTITLTRLALDNRAILEALDQGEAPATLDTFAKQLQRDPSNVRKSLKALAVEGLILGQTAPGQPQAALTDAGRQMLAGMLVAEGRLSAALPALTRDQIEPDPDQPRKQFDQGELEELAESVADRGLLEPILIRLLDDGSARLVAGERRWRAIGLLIAAEDPRWPADRAVPYHLSIQTDDAEILADQVVENLQRARLHPLEEAEAFRTLKAVHGWGVGRIAKTASKTRRFVEQRLDLLNLTPVQQGRMRLAKDHPDHLTTARAREMVQHLRQISSAALDQRDIEEIAPSADVAAASAEDEAAARKPKLTPRELMLLGEIAAAAAARPSDRFPNSPRPVVDVDSEKAVASQSFGRLNIAKFATLLIDGAVEDSPAGARVEDLGHLRLRLESLHPADNPRALFHLRREAGISADQARQLQKLGQWATPFLTLPDRGTSSIEPSLSPANPVDQALSRAEWFSQETQDTALRISRERPGHERDLCAKVSGTTTADGETWPAQATETLRTPWDGYPTVEIRLAVSDKGRWQNTLSTGAGGPTYGGRGEPPFVYTNDPLFRSRADAIAHAAARAVEQLGEWGTKRKLQAWLAELQAGPQAAEPQDAPQAAAEPKTLQLLQCPVNAPEWRLPWITIAELEDARGNIGYRAILRHGHAQMIEAQEFSSNPPLALTRKAEALQRRFRTILPIEVMDWLDTLQGANVVDGVDYYNASRAAQARAERDGTPGTKVDAVELTAAEILILRELGHALDLAEGQAVPVGAYWLDHSAVGLWKRSPAALVEFKAAPGQGWTAELTEAGRAQLQVLAEDFDPLSLELRIEREGRFASAWLNPQEATPIGDQLGEDPDADEAAEESDLLNEVRAELAAGAPDPGKLLQLVGLVGEFVADDLAFVRLEPTSGSITDVAAVDPHRLEPEDLACARAELIAFALNAFARSAAQIPAKEAA